MTTTLRQQVELIRLPLVLGLTDGLLNALTLASASLWGTGAAVSVQLAARVGCASLVTAAFTVFVADYAERRAHLIRAARELNLTRKGQLAATRLGRLAVMRALRAMAVACLASFLGAALPLALGALLPGPRWIVALLAIAALAVLGALLARILAGRPGVWALAMGCGGAAVTAVGTWLHIV
ncbi:hypothetical protein GXW82_33070 [Streptacidiphilus sp. 4-A2]|nr:hypothetical protein [Streptacidiphilus sp. 4-A2]